MNFHQIPAELRERRQWVLWRSEKREGKLTKVPYRSADPGRRADSTDPQTWGSFEEAVASADRVDGIGFAFSPDDPYTGIDLDDCLDGEKVEPTAEKILELLDSYTERSVSGTGVHVIVKAKLNGSRRRSGKVEIYDSGRFFVMTGDASPRPRSRSVSSRSRSSPRRSSRSHLSRHRSRSLSPLEGTSMTRIYLRRPATLGTGKSSGRSTTPVISLATTRPPRPFSPYSTCSPSGLAGTSVGSISSSAPRR